MSAKEQIKATREREIFTRFLVAAGLSVDAGSVSSQQAPLPDIGFTSAGERWHAELSEVVDRSLARRRSESLRTKKITGGAFSQDGPLKAVLRRKAAARYDTGGEPIILVLYFDKQYPPPDNWGVVPALVADAAVSMVKSGRWHGIWVYDDWNSRVIWSFGEPPSA